MISIRKFKYSAVAFLLLFSNNMVLANDMSEHAIIERIAPIGDVRLSDDLNNEVTTAATAEPAKPRTAQSIYNTFCTVCHASGIAGAPKIGDKPAWDTRLAKGREMVNKHAIQGFNAMPAKGTCMNCSDEEIISTIDYMLSQ